MYVTLSLLRGTRVHGFKSNLLMHHRQILLIFKRLGVTLVSGNGLMCFMWGLGLITSLDVKFLEYVAILKKDLVIGSTSGYVSPHIQSSCN